MRAIRALLFRPAVAVDGAGPPRNGEGGAGRGGKTPKERGACGPSASVAPLASTPRGAPKAAAAMREKERAMRDALDAQAREIDELRRQLEAARTTEQGDAVAAARPPASEEEHAEPTTRLPRRLAPMPALPSSKAFNAAKAQFDALKEQALKDQEARHRREVALLSREMQEAESLAGELSRNHERALVAETSEGARLVEEQESRHMREREHLKRQM